MKYVFSRLSFFMVLLNSGTVRTKGCKSRFSSFMILLMFVIFGGSGCATYNETVVVNTDKSTVFHNFGSYQKLDYRQIYYDPAKKIEIFAPTLSQWELVFGRSQKPSDILIFEGVTRPTGCPLTSKSQAPTLSSYYSTDGYCYMGNGRLKGYFKSESLFEPLDTSDYQGVALRTIYQTYVENEEQETLIRMAVCNCSKEDAEELLAEDRIRENWFIVRANYLAYEYMWKNQSLSWADFDKRVKADETFLARAVHSSYYDQYNTGRVTTAYKKPVKKINSKSSNDFNLFDLLIDAAVDVWIYKEKAKISQKQLDKIYAASRRGARAGARSANRQKAIMDNLKIAPKIGCESYGC